ncbi:MAG: hypothetical protein KDC82_01210 [Bacteroidetes bacterium]|nr:hypothetical protein [Bacteroidota bacterium]
MNAVELDVRTINSRAMLAHNFSNLECCVQHIYSAIDGLIVENRDEFFHIIKTYYCQKCHRREYRWWSDALVGLPPTYGPIPWENPCRGCNQRTIYVRSDVR